MAWKSWRKWAAVSAEVGSVFLPGRFAVAAEKGAEKLKQAEEERKRREAAEADKQSVVLAPRDLL